MIKSILVNSQMIKIKEERWKLKDKTNWGDATSGVKRYTEIIMAEKNRKDYRNGCVESNRHKKIKWVTKLFKEEHEKTTNKNNYKDNLWIQDHAVEIMNLTKG